MFDDPDADYKVLINAEEQYSLWPADLTTPDGWDVGFTGNKDACLRYVDEVWTDMRPLSLRRRMEAASGGAPTSNGPA